jgi:flavin reductase (DIM6/NTAB) family NADH-FMN oxidoreductase RutF
VTRPDDEASDAVDRLRRRVLWAMPTGLYVVGSRAGDQRNLMTANWVVQVATTPKLVAVGIEADSVTRSLVEEGGRFSVSLLARSDRALVRRFVKPVRAVDVGPSGAAVAMQGEPVREVAGGLPVLGAAVAWLACEVRSVVGWDGLVAPGGAPSHVLAVGEVTEVGVSERFDGLGDGTDAGILSMDDTRMSYGG